MWQQKRIWYVPQPHRLLSSVTCSAAAAVAAFEVQLLQPALAFLWHHQVRAVQCIKGGIHWAAVWFCDQVEGTEGTWTSASCMRIDRRIIIEDARNNSNGKH